MHTNTHSPSSVLSGISDRLTKRLDQAIDRAIRQQRIVGGVVMAALDGAWIYRRAAGWADRDRQQAMQENSLFRLSSISKPYISTLLMIFVAQGKIALDDDIRQYLPEFRTRLADGSAARINIRHLLTHTSGLGYRFFETDENGPYAQAGISDGMDEAGITLVENLRRIASVPLYFAPGSHWRYSLAIDVLGAVIEQVCGLPLQTALEKWLTTPLGLHDTAFTAVAPARLCTAYVNAAPMPRVLQEAETVAAFPDTVGIRYSPARALNVQAYPSGGAGMVGSAGDFLSLLECLRQGGGAILPADLVEEMGRIQTGALELAEVPGCGFGLGFSVLRDPQVANSPESPGTWRWGGAYGHSWFVDRARRLSVVAFTNTLYEGMAGQFVNDVRDAVYAGLGSVET